MSGTRSSRLAVLACLVLSALMLVLPAAASAAVSVTRAELKSGELRVEGRGATPDGTVTVTADSVASGRADGSGAFRVETTGFRAASCRATVSDGTSSVETALEGCTATAPSPSPTPSPTPTPTPTPTATASGTLVIVDDSLPSGNVGTQYSASLFSRGARGDKPVEYRVVAGQLPAGLSITRSFGVASALITGTPIVPGTSFFTVEAQTAPGSGRRSRSRSGSIRRHHWSSPTRATSWRLEPFASSTRSSCSRTAAPGRTAGHSPAGSFRRASH
jgi:hypothetical protein